MKFMIVRYIVYQCYVLCARVHKLQKANISGSGPLSPLKVHCLKRELTVRSLCLRITCQYSCRRSVACLDAECAGGAVESGVGRPVGPESPRRRGLQRETWRCGGRFRTRGTPFHSLRQGQCQPSYATGSGDEMDGAYVVPLRFCVQFEPLTLPKRLQFAGVVGVPFAAESRNVQAVPAFILF